MTTLYDILDIYPSESLSYEDKIDMDLIENELEHPFDSIVELNADDEKSKLLSTCLEIGLAPDLDSVRIFHITNEIGKTCKFAVWGE